MNTSKPTGGENPPTKESPRGKPKYNKRAHSNEKKKPATLEHLDKEIKETTPLSPTEFHPTKTAGKAEHLELQNQIKTVT